MNQVVTNKRIGLALGGGMARGPVHVGVLAALERAGIPIHCVAGTSAGAVVGSAYCAGLDIPQLRSIALETSWMTIASLTPSPHGLVTFRRMEPFIENLIGTAVDIRDLAIPFTAVVTDMQNGYPVHLREGRLATAVRASSSVPGMVSPVEINGRFYCDGGVTDNLPIDALPAMGADYLIGVDLFMPIYRRGLGFWGATTAAIELLIRSSGGGAHLADCLIVPELSGHNYFDFSRRKSEEYIALGEAAAEQMIPTIMAAITAPTEESYPMPFVPSQPTMAEVMSN